MDNHRISNTVLVAAGALLILAASISGVPVEVGAGFMGVALAATATTSAIIAFGHDNHLDDFERHLARCRRREERSHLLVLRLAGAEPAIATSVLDAFRRADDVKLAESNGELHALLCDHNLDRISVERRLRESIDASAKIAWATFPDDGVTVESLLSVARGRLVDADGPDASNVRGWSGLREPRPTGGSLARRALVTGCAGFIGSHLTERLLDDGLEVVGVDSFTDFYARTRKERNLSAVRANQRFEFRELDLASDTLGGLLDDVQLVFHLAGQAGVRPSFGEGFADYLRQNVHVTQRLLDQAVACPLDAFVYASSSSVYGNAARFPTPEDSELRPVSPYGMTKVATENIAGVYQRDFGVPVIGLRYFTVYGPRQRPDMAFYRFVLRALAGEPLPIYGDGRQLRDFTYVADAVEATVAAAVRGRPGTVYNVGGGHPVELLTVVSLLETLLARPIPLERSPGVDGDARKTSADGSRAARHLGFAPRVELRDGLARQVESMLAEAEDIAGLTPKEVPTGGSVDAAAGTTVPGQLRLSG